MLTRSVLQMRYQCLQEQDLVGCTFLLWENKQSKKCCLLANICSSLTKQYHVTVEILNKSGHKTLTTATLVFISLDLDA
jgi:glycerol-3-phosphate O-acyltransferase